MGATRVSLDQFADVFYYLLKLEAREVVAQAINERNAREDTGGNWKTVELASIGPDALDFARLEWPKHYSAATHWGLAYSWEKLYHRFAARPSFFDLAVWQVVDGRRVLQALALGRPSNGKTHLCLNWVERSFAPTYLKGTLIPVLACAEEYAKLLGCSRVLLHEPVDPERYKRYGYAPYKLPKVQNRYLCKELVR